ncbi:MAG: glycosyltransferase family 2 protein [Candidatus Gallimonas sp.]
MWHEYLFRVLSILNYIVLIMIAIPVLLQVFYVLFAFVRKKTWKKSEVKGRVAYLIPAHNEESVIGKTVKDLMARQNYPKELYDVYVVAHNCTDRTAQIAREAGAKVLVLDDPDPAHRMALYPVKHGIDYLIGLEGEAAYDFVIRIDADNHVNADFTSLMNDAYQSGVQFARGYEGALNGTQNFYTKACALFYSFDSRFGSRVRERLGIAAHINGSGAMMSVALLKESGGFDCVSISEDAEYNFNRMLEGKKGHFVEDAIVYEDMPSSFQDTLNRNKRIGSGSMSLIKGKLLKMLGKFFTTGNFSFLEMFLTYSFNFLTILISIWIPLYYVYHFTYTALIASGTIAVSMMPVAYYRSMLFTTLIVAAAIVGGLFVLFGYGQAALLAVLDYKKLGAKKRRELVSAVLLFPVFLLLYAVTLCIGALSKPKWNKIATRSGSGDDDANEDRGEDMRLSA